MGTFDGIGKAQAKRDGNYIQPGNYICRIDRVKTDKNRSDGVFVAAEMTVVHVISEEPGSKAHVVGESMSRLFCDYGPGKDYFLPEVKAFFQVAMGCTADEIDTDSADHLAPSKEAHKRQDGTVRPANATSPINGTIVEIHAKTKYGKSTPQHPTGKPRTDVVFKRKIRATAIKNNDIANGGMLTEQEKIRFFQPGVLEAAIKLEQAEDAAVAPARAA